MLPTVQILSEIARSRNNCGDGGGMSQESPRNKDDTAKEHDQGIRHRSVSCSSLRVQKGSSLRGWGGGRVTIISHSFDISIAAGVGEMVHHQIPSQNSIFFLFFFLYPVLCIFQVRGPKTTCSASYGKEKTPGPLDVSSSAP